MFDMEQSLLYFPPVFKATVTLQAKNSRFFVFDIIRWYKHLSTIQTSSLPEIATLFGNLTILKEAVLFLENCGKRHQGIINLA